MCDYQQNLEERLRNHFDLTQNVTLGGLCFPLLGEMRVAHAKYAVSKKVEIYSFETKEYVLYASKVNPTKMDIQEMVQEIKPHIPSVVTPNSNHRSSQLLLVISTNSPISPELERFVRKFHYQKGFLFGFKGWVDLYIVLVSFPENRVVHHKRIKQTAEFFIPKRRDKKEQ